MIKCILKPLLKNYLSKLIQQNPSKRLILHNYDSFDYKTILYNFITKQNKVIYYILYPSLNLTKNIHLFKISTIELFKKTNFS